MAQELAHVPIAAAAFAQDTELRPLELRERGKLLTCDEIEHGAASHTAADNPEAGAVCHGCQPRWRAELTHKQPSRIELGSDLRAAEDNAQVEIDSVLAKEALFDAQPQLQAASIRGYAIGESFRHRGNLFENGLAAVLTPKKPAGNPARRA